MRESAAIERELGDVRRRLRESRQELVQVNGRLDMVRRRLEQIDDGITAAAEEAAEVKAEIASLAKEKELVGERLRTLLSTASRARAELVDEPEAAEAPALPPRPEPPIHLRVEVESLRRERSRLEGAVARMRREVEALQAEDPLALRAALADARGRARRRARSDWARPTRELAEWAERHHAAVNAARESRDRHAETNRAWREQAAEADRIRESHEDEERGRLDLERRIVEAERLLREGHRREPEEAVRGARRGRHRRVAAAPRRPGRAPARDGRPRQPAGGRRAGFAPRALRVHDARAGRREGGAARPRRRSSARSTGR